ncbi:unnamed protein product [Discosporangium mesarthrocarpum]
MVNPWRGLVPLVLAVLFTALAGVPAFVIRAPLGGSLRTGPTSSRLSMNSMGRPVGRGPPAGVWECLAPGGKVGRQKVSLDRGVVSIAQPKQQSGQQSEQKAKNATKTKRAVQTDDAPMFKVLLIGDEEYNREHVVMAIQDIVPDVDNTKAAEIFDEAQIGGKGMCGIYPEEQAELYVEQFTRCEPLIYADMEKDGSRKNLPA